MPEFSPQSMRVTDWLIAAGAAAFIAAGVIAVLPLDAQSSSDRASPDGQAEPAGSDRIFETRFDWQPQTPVEEGSTSDAGDRGSGFPGDVRVVRTQTIKIEPIVTTAPVQTASLSVAAFAAGETAPVTCGLSLTRTDDRNAIVFYHDVGANDDAGHGVLKVDDQVVTLARVETSGDALGFGQFPIQVFESRDGSIRAMVDISLGQDTAGSLRRPVTRGRLIVTAGDGRAVTLSVAGDAGC